MLKRCKEGGASHLDMTGVIIMCDVHEHSVCHTWLQNTSGRWSEEASYRLPPIVVHQPPQVIGCGSRHGLCEV